MINQRKRVLVIGFQSRNQRMYPHLYDVLQVFDDRCDLTYIGQDDRGYGLYDIPATIFCRRSSLVKKYRDFLTAFRRWWERRKACNEIIKSLQQNFDVVLALDHHACLLATSHCHLNTRVVFWSHDILTDDVHYLRSPLIRYLREKNRRQAHRLSLVIVQDPAREAVLHSILGTYLIPVYHLPVSLLDDEFAREASRVRLLKIPEEPIQLMQITACARRGSAELLKVWQQVADRSDLHFQGFVGDNMLGPLQCASKKPFIHSTADSFAMMRAKIAEMDIGFVCYLRQELNEMLTAHASGQLVEFLRLGIPVIAAGIGTLGLFVEEKEVGIYLRDLNDIGHAIDQICKNYSFFSQNARQCYEGYFRLQNYVPSLCEALESSDSSQ